MVYNNRISKLKTQMSNMKKLVIAGNWKSNKTIDEAQNWLRQFNLQPNTKIILCPAFIHLQLFRWFIDTNKCPFELGAQDVSRFPSGAYTGEVNAHMLKGLVEWVMVGHSERRAHLQETDAILAQKVARVKEAGLKVLFCVEDEKSVIPSGVEIVAYEPVWAIGTGKSDTPENANMVTSAIKAKTQASLVLYGGSVKPENVASFVTQPAIDGVLVGGASLDPEQFKELISSCSQIS